MANVTGHTPTATNQSNPPRTPVLEQNPDVNDTDDGTMADVMGGVVADELVAEPGSETNRSEQVQLQLQVAQKRRGRPRKYNSDGNILSCENSTKKSRGRPRGSGRLQALASIGGFVAETAGGSFAPHVLTVATGEDVMSRIASFSQRGTQSVCMISATGAVSSVVIALASGGTLTYEGRFDILSFSGACTYGGIGGAHYKKGAFSVSLAKPDGKVFGGCIEGPMIAASPIQLVVGSFKQNLVKQMIRKCLGEGSAARKRPSCNPDVTTPVRVSNQEANMIEYGQKWTSPTSGLMPSTPSTVKGVADNVTPASANQNIHPPAAALNGVGLESPDGEALKSIIDNENGVQGI